MLKRAVRVIALAAVLAVLSGACGSDLPSGTNSGDQLAQAEVAELVGALFEVFQLIDVDIPGLHRTDPRLSFSRAGVPIDETFSGTDPCDAGMGSVSISGRAQGDVDSTTGGKVTLEATVTMTRCRVIGEATTYTLDGDPELGVIAEFDIGPQSATLRIQVGGGVAFTTLDGRSGTCALDMIVNAALNATGVTETLSGRACGVNAAGLGARLFTDDGF